MKSIAKKLTIAAFGFGALTWGGAALADGWPANITGTWNVKANLSNGQLIITSQGPTGQCRQIAGTIFGNPITGFYCPASGRIAFLRGPQAYVGNLSQTGGNQLRMGGTFAAFPGGGSLGEYEWWAVMNII